MCILQRAWWLICSTFFLTKATASVRIDASFLACRRSPVTGNNFRPRYRASWSGDETTPPPEEPSPILRQDRILINNVGVEENNDKDASGSCHSMECKATKEQTKIEHSAFSDRHHRLFLQSASCFFPMAAILLLLPLPSPAEIHPVDFPSLGIPLTIPDIRYFLSGGLCAAASHGITTPIDVVKTRIQAEPLQFNEGLLRASQSIIRNDGPQALLGGLGPTVVGYGLEGAMKFGVYESLKPVMMGVLNTENPTVPYLGASVIAGAIASVMLCPMERTRIRLVTDPDFASGLVTGLPRLIKEEGLPYVFSGIPAMLSKQVPYTITKQVSFDIFATFLYTAAANANLSSSPNIKIEVSVGAAFLASILSCITSHPGDVILTSTYKQTSGGGDDGGGSGFAQVVSDVYENQGLNGFFTGLTARLFHVGAIITSQLVLYDVIKQLLGLPATGSH